MIILTGGAGFIGSVLLRQLNEAGHKDVLVVDAAAMEHSQNLKGKSYKFEERDSFVHSLKSFKPSDVEAILHIGAITSTTETNKALLTKYNFEYSKSLAEWAFEHNVRFIYASSAATYGDGSNSFGDSDDVTRKLKPLNLYGQSKQDFDVWLMDKGDQDRACGFKFFNVFGPNEYHKADMASLVFKAYNQINETGALRLFKSADPRYKDGEFKRDFIYVMDAVDVVMWALANPDVNGIFNLGTGQARSWNDLANAMFDAMKKPRNIIYIDMPENVRSQYQYFTEADMSKLRAAGYSKPFQKLEDSVSDYARNYLMKADQYY
ncbi:MAG: ADP-glyceromanno-heptose 6-epimerase [Candidatus Kapaibacterium sp.]